VWQRVNQLTKKYGVSRITIGNWIRAGRFNRVQRTKGGHYRVWIEEEIETIGYTRVSSQKQASSLRTQQQLILRQYPEVRVVSDIGSGFNFKRKGFRAILERCLCGTSVRVVVTSGDRLARAGFQLVKWAIELHGGSVVELEKECEQQEFDVADLVRFLTCFIASHHGKRNARRKKNKSVPVKQEAVG
jgi:predicted site-specific integrase-resolvase